jgi:hypothetical protein
VTEQATVKRLRPGQGSHLWALAPATLWFGDRSFDPRLLPALYAPDPPAAVWLALGEEGLLVLGPYGFLGHTEALVEEAVRVARETGQRELWARVRNDEVDRWAVLQRAGFALAEARVGALRDGPESRLGGDMAVRDELILRRGVDG